MTRPHFSCHKEMLRTNRFLVPSTQNFIRSESLIWLYYPHVRSRLEYCRTVWNPYYDKYKKQLEKVQRKFTRMLCYKFKWPKQDYWRLELDQMILYKLVHGKVDANILKRLCAHESQRFTRQNAHHLLYLLTPAWNVQLNSPVRRMQNNYNKRMLLKPYLPKSDAFSNGLLYALEAQIFFFLSCSMLV